MSDLILNPYSFGAPLVYTTLNPNDKNANITLSNGNLTSTGGTTAGWRGVRACFGKRTGKLYFEMECVTVGSGGMVGVGKKSATLTDYHGRFSDGWGYQNTGNKWNNNSTTAIGTTYTSGDRIPVAVDLDAGYLWWAKESTWLQSGNPATGANPMYSNLGANTILYPMYSCSGTVSNVSDFYFDPATVEESIPSGFSCWTAEGIAFEYNHGSNWGSITGRTTAALIPVSMLPALACSGEVRVKIKSAPAKSGKVEFMYIGHQASSGDAYDFDATAFTQLLFSGVAGVTVSADTEQWSDWASFDYDGSRPLILATQWDSDSATYAWRQSAATGITEYYKTATGEAGTADKTGYSTQTNRLTGLMEIEMRIA